MVPAGLWSRQVLVRIRPRAAQRVRPVAHANMCRASATRKSKLAAAVARRSATRRRCASLGLCATGGNWRSLKKWLDTLGDRDGALRRAGAARRGASGPPAARGDPRRAVHLRARATSRCGSTRGTQGSALRALRAGRAVARRADGARSSTTSTASATTIGSRTCGSSVPTARRRSIRTAAARTGSSRPERACLLCGERFRRAGRRASATAHELWNASPRPSRGVPKPERRRVERPPYAQLVREIAETSYVAVGRQVRRLGQRDPQVGAPVRARGAADVGRRASRAAPGAP